MYNSSNYSKAKIPYTSFNSHLANYNILTFLKEVPISLKHLMIESFNLSYSRLQRISPVTYKL